MTHECQKQPESTCRILQYVVRLNGLTYCVTVQSGRTCEYPEEKEIVTIIYMKHLFLKIFINIIIHLFSVMPLIDFCSFNNPANNMNDTNRWEFNQSLFCWYFEFSEFNQYLSTATTTLWELVSPMDSWMLAICLRSTVPPTTMQTIQCSNKKQRSFEFQNSWHLTSADQTLGSFWPRPRYSSLFCSLVLAMNPSFPRTVPEM